MDDQALKKFRRGLKDDDKVTVWTGGTASIATVISTSPPNEALKKKKCVLIRHDTGRNTRNWMDREDLYPPDWQPSPLDFDNFCQQCRLLNAHRKDCTERMFAEDVPDGEERADEMMRRIMDLD